MELRLRGFKTIKLSLMLTNNDDLANLLLIINEKKA